MIPPTTTAMGPRATPTQKTTQLPIIRPIPATMKAARATQTAVQAAGVLPWWAMELLQVVRSGRGQCSGSGGRSCRLLARAGVGRVTSLVEGGPEVLLAGRAGLGDRCGGSGCVVPAAHLRPGRDEPDGENGRHECEDRAHR